MRINMHFHNKYFTNEEILKVADYLNIERVIIVGYGRMEDAVEYQIYIPIFKHDITNTPDRPGITWVCEDKFRKYVCWHGGLEGLEDNPEKLLDKYKFLGYDGLIIMPERTKNLEKVVKLADQMGYVIYAGTEVNRPCQSFFIDTDNYPKIKNVLEKYL